MLSTSYSNNLIEAGCDEAGRGCLAGPVYAAAVIFSKDYFNTELNDSKKLSEKQREKLLPIIERDALAFAIAWVENHEIDKINILNASFRAMHQALAKLSIEPQLILVDGNRFKPFGEIKHECIVKGDGKFLSIAAASVLAKTYRDRHMLNLHEQYPEYEWNKNKGYPTLKHRKITIANGFSPYHRKTFAVQLKVWE